jgi:hypothetical protein
MVSPNNQLLQVSYLEDTVFSNQVKYLNYLDLFNSQQPIQPNKPQQVAATNLFPSQTSGDKYSALAELDSIFLQPTAANSTQPIQNQTPAPVVSTSNNPFSSPFIPQQQQQQQQVSGQNLFFNNGLQQQQQQQVPFNYFTLATPAQNLFSQPQSHFNNMFPVMTNQQQQVVSNPFIVSLVL